MKSLLLICLITIGRSPVSAGCCLDGAGRVVAVGDVHGDFSRFVMVLRHAGLIDNSKNWCGGKTRLVQTGDILDRGPDSRLVMDLIMKLEQQAPIQGGAVHFLLGNHESMLLSGDIRYVHPGEADSHGGFKEMIRNMRLTGRYGKWLAAHNAVVRINHTLFLHAGISEEYSEFSPEQINDAVRKALLFPEEHYESRGSEGPLWYRGWAVDRSSAAERTVEQALESSGASFAVIGHTVRIQGIGTRFAGRVIMIDTGLSEHYGGPVQYLEISGDGHKAVTVLESVE